MIYHYYDPWAGVQIWNKPATTTNYPVWTTVSGIDPHKVGKISVVKSDNIATLVVRDKSGHLLIVVDLNEDEVTDLVERLTGGNGSTVAETV